MLTDEQPGPEQIKALRAMTGEERLEAAERLYWSARKMKAAGLRCQHPDWPEHEYRRTYGAFSQMPEAELFLLFVRPLQRAGIRYIVTGSVAAIFYGEPRLTLDVDLVVFLNEKDIGRLRDFFPSSDFYLPPSEIIATEARREMRGHFNILHVPTGFKADVYSCVHGVSFYGNSLIAKTAEINNKI